MSDAESVDRGWGATADKAAARRPTGRWQVNTRGRKVIEMSQAELLTSFKAGKITPRSLVWADGMQEWTPLGEVPALASLTRTESEPPLSGARPIADEAVPLAAQKIYESTGSEPPTSPGTSTASLAVYERALATLEFPDALGPPESSDDPTPALGLKSRPNAATEAELGPDDVVTAIEPDDIAPAPRPRTTDPGPPPILTTPEAPRPAPSAPRPAAPTLAALGAAKAPSASPSSASPSSASPSSASPSSASPSSAPRATAAGAVVAVANGARSTPLPVAAPSTSTPLPARDRPSAPPAPRATGSAVEKLAASLAAGGPAAPPVTPAASAAGKSPGTTASPLAASSSHTTDAAPTKVHHPAPAADAAGPFVPPRPAIEFLPPIIVQEKEDDGASGVIDLPLPGNVHVPMEAPFNESTLVLSGRRRARRWVPLGATVAVALGAASLASALTVLFVRGRPAPSPRVVEKQVVVRVPEPAADTAPAAAPRPAAAARATTAPAATPAPEAPSPKRTATAKAAPAPATGKAPAERTARAEVSASSHTWQRDDPGQLDASASQAHRGTRAGFPTNPGF